MQSEQIWIVSQDEDDHEIISMTLSRAKIPNEVRFFTSPADLLNNLKDAERAPFIIMSDVNLHGMNGFQLREKMLEASNAKFHSVPFIFWSEHASDAQIKQAFDLRAHGFFIKETTSEAWKQTFLEIISYWSKSKMPNKKDKNEPPLA